MWKLRGMQIFSHKRCHIKSGHHFSCSIGAPFGFVKAIREGQNHCGYRLIFNQAWLLNNASSVCWTTLLHTFSDTRTKPGLQLGTKMSSLNWWSQAFQRNINTQTHTCERGQNKVVDSGIEPQKSIKKVQTLQSTKTRRSLLSYLSIRKGSENCVIFFAR